MCDQKLASYSVSQAFDCHPFDRKRTVCFLAIIIGFVDIFGEAEVANLDNVVGREEYVSASQVAVHDFLAGQILHAPRDLVGPANEIFGRNWAHRLGVVIATDI